MIQPGILTCVLKNHHILDTLHHAYRRAVATLIGAYRTDLGFGYVVAHGTISYTLPHIYYGLTESHSGPLVTAQDM